VGAYILAYVDTVHKNAMDVVLWTTRLQTVPRRHGTDGATYEVQAWELI